MSGAYYNEFDPFAAAWLRNLIKAGLIADGDVDERSIADVIPADLAGYTQCHFFAGIGGWSLALRMAGWQDGRRVWTGSCPCQPLSSAGEQKGSSDHRHLWPVFHDLIEECRPSIVFGEQVASKLGREWLAGVRLDLEDMDYACGASDLCAAGVGAPHIRQRLYWVAHTDLPRQYEWPSGGEQQVCDGLRIGPEGLEHAEGSGPQEQWGEYRPSGERCSGLVGFAVQAGVPRWNGPTVAIECSDGPRRISAQPDAFPRKRLQGMPVDLPAFTDEQLDYVAKIAERERTYDGSYLITGPRKTP